MPTTSLPICRGCGQPTTDTAPLGCDWPHGGLDPAPVLLWHPDDCPPRAETP